MGRMLRTYVRNAFMKEADGCVRTAPRPTSVERKCFYRFVIHRGWEFVVIVEGTFIRISFFRI